ncbi:PEP-CTERM sorting domain-containing protein [Acaryochloris thomasi]|nr:PEP-CTERM sorting domain-containing protein [Acaryochloris thomasi]
MKLDSVHHLFMLVMGSTALALGNVNPAAAVSITFEGSLTNGETVTGEVSSENSIEIPANWDFWTFEGTAGSSERFTARRTSTALDPAFGIWFGTEVDTDSYSSLFGDSLNTSLVVSADDEINTPGPFGDPTVRFTLPDTGTYTVAVASFISDSSDEPLGYTLRVPFSDSATILGSGLVLGLGMLLKRRFSNFT